MTMRMHMMPGDILPAQEMLETGCPAEPSSANPKGGFSNNGDAEANVPQQPKSDQTCAICGEDLNARSYFGTHCKHHFHVMCLAPWVASAGSTCPVCRAEFVPQEFQLSLKKMNENYDQGLTSIEWKQMRSICWRCKVCKIVVPTARALHRHKTLAHGGRFVCCNENCVRSFGSVAKLVIHLIKGNHRATTVK